MLVFIDIETTGVTSSDKICSIALIYDGGYIYELLNEKKRIKPEASAVHHITNEMIKDKPSFKDSKSFEFLTQNNSITLVGHNMEFILNKLALSGFNFTKDFIDTKRVTKHKLAEYVDSFSLQYLRYELILYKDENTLAKSLNILTPLIAYNALSDALVVKLLYNYLLDYAKYDDMILLSSKNVLVSKFKFGKYADEYIEDVLLKDRNYIFWLLDNALDLDEDLRYSLNYYLKRN